MSMSASSDLFASVPSQTSVFVNYQELICIYFSHGSRIDTVVSGSVTHYFTAHTVSIPCIWKCISANI